MFGVNQGNNNILNYGINRPERIGVRIAKVAVVAFSAALLVGAAGTAFYFAVPLFVAGGFAIAGGVALTGAGIGSLLGIGCSFGVNTDLLNRMFHDTDTNMMDSLKMLGFTLGLGAFTALMGAIIPAFIAIIVLGIAFLGYIGITQNAPI